MAETVKVLAEAPGNTIVLVGALAPARFVESDAAFNLGMAFASTMAFSVTLERAQICGRASWTMPGARLASSAADR